MSEEITLEFLEDIVEEMRKAGDEWATAHQLARRLEEGKKTFLARIKNEFAKDCDMRGQKYTETYLEREALAEDRYKEYIDAMSNAEGEALRLKTRWETLKNHFEARRSYVSLEKAKVNLI